jgi:Uma2 family endonuclease
MRDREAKLKLYSRRGVSKYWLVDWTAQTVEIHRRKRQAGFNRRILRPRHAGNAALVRL